MEVEPWARAAGKADCWYEIDGGVKDSTIAEAVKAGADLIVAGTAVFGKDDPAAACHDLLELGRAAAK